MKRNLIIVGLVAALALPTASFAASHRSGHKTKSAAAATAPKAKAKGSGARSGAALRFRPSRTVPVGAKTKAKSKPQAGTRAGRHPKTKASAGSTKTAVGTKRNNAVGLPGVNVSLNQGVGSSASGQQGLGGTALPSLPTSGTGI